MRASFARGRRRVAARPRVSVTAAQLRRLHAEASAHVFATYEPKLAAELERVFKRTGKEAARRFRNKTLSHLVASLRAAGPPAWTPPPGDEIVDVDAIVSVLRTKMDPVRLKAIEASMTPLLHAQGLSFDVTNPLVSAAVTNTGQHIVNIAETTRANVLRIIGASYEQGLSIPDTAKAIQVGMAAASTARARMIARTELVRNVNAGALAATQTVADATGTTFYARWLTAPGAEYPRHEDYDGLDGQTVATGDFFDVGGYQLRYPGDPDGPPGETINCLAEGTEVSLPGLRYAMRRWYEGDLVRLRFAGGGYLAVTPNHPVLRADGRWTAASELNVGDHCVGGRLIGHFSSEPNIEGVPAEVGEVYRAADSMTAQSQRISLRPGWLHGDGADGQVDVVPVEGKLRFGIDTASTKQVAEFGLALAERARPTPRDIDSAFMLSHVSRVREPPGLSPPSSIRGSGETPPFLGRSLLHSHVHRLAEPASGNVALLEPSSDAVSTDSQRLSESLLAFPSEVTLHEIVDIEQVPSWVGWVYNFDSGHGWYLSGNGISIACGNCRCTLAFVEDPNAPIPAQDLTDIIDSPVGAPDGDTGEAPTLTADEQAAFTSLFGQNMLSGSARDTWEFLNAGEIGVANAPRLRAIDGLLGRGVLPKGATATRKISHSEELNFFGLSSTDVGPEVGAIGYDPSYGLASLQETPVYAPGSLAGGTSPILTYHLPPGMNALDIGRISAAKADEDTLLLPRGLPLRVLGTTTRDGIENIHVEVVGKEVVPPTTTGYLKDVKLPDVPLEPVVGDSAYQVAGQLAINAAREEVPVSAALRSAVEGRGGKLEGYGFRVKSTPSLARKIDKIENEFGLPARAAALVIKDSLRYTAVYEPDVYIKQMEATLADLRQNGVVVERVRATWQTNSDYVGTNMVMRAPNGFRFELQFHTPQSFDVKEHINHALYQKERRLPFDSAEAAKLRDEMRANANDVVRPPGIVKWRYDQVSAEGDIGVTPFNADTDNPIGFYDSQKFKQFEGDVHDLAKVYGVTVDEETRANGLWLGEEEPSVRLRVHDGEAGVKAYSAALARKYDQFGVVLFNDQLGEDLVATFRATGANPPLEPADLTEALAKVGIDGGRFLPDGTFQVMGSGPEFVAQMDALAREVGGVSYDYRVGRFSYLERDSGDYEAAIRDFGGAQGEPLRTPGGADEGHGGPAAPRQGVPGAPEAPQKPPLAELAQAPDPTGETLAKPSLPAVPHYTQQQIKFMSQSRLWHEHGYLGKIENLARAEIADAEQQPIIDALWAKAERSPKGTIRYGDLAGDRQVHTIYSDGHNTVREVAEQAFERGQTEVVISDHSHLLTPQKILNQHAQIDNVNRDYAGKFKVIKGVEANILADGTIDLAPDVEGFDIVNAAIHGVSEQPGGQQVLFSPLTNTERLLKAMDDPRVKVLVHPHSVDADWDAVAAKASERGVALEVNGRDLLRNDREGAAAAMIAAAKKYGAKLVFGSDAHSTLDLIDLRYAVQFAARHGVTVADVAPLQLKGALSTRISGLFSPLKAPDPETLVAKAEARSREVADKILLKGLVDDRFHGTVHNVVQETLGADSNREQAKIEVMRELARRLEGNPDWEQTLANNHTAMAGWVGYHGSTETEERVSGLIQGWAESSADDDARSLAMQRAIADEFKLPVPDFLTGRVGWAESEALYAKVGPALRAFARVMYDNTQEQLAAAGIRDLVLYRGQGLADREREVLLGKAHSGMLREAIEMQPASSFAAQYEAASFFTRGNPTMIATEVPRERILGTCRSGFGCLNEWEFVVLGEPEAVTDDAWVWTSRADRYETKPSSAEQFWLKAKTADAAPDDKFTTKGVEVKQGERTLYTNIDEGFMFEYQGAIYAKPFASSADQVGSKIAGSSAFPAKLTPSDFHFDDQVTLLAFRTSDPIFAKQIATFPEGTRVYVVDPKFADADLKTVYEVNHASGGWALVAVDVPPGGFESTLYQKDVADAGGKVWLAPQPKG